MRTSPRVVILPKWLSILLKQLARICLKYPPGFDTRRRIWTGRIRRPAAPLRCAILPARPEMEMLRDNMADYDTVYLGFPIWWYVAPRIINTFLEAHDLSGKTIIPFATSGGSGLGDTVKLLASSCPEARFLNGRVFSPSASQTELLQWANQCS